MKILKLKLGDSNLDRIIDYLIRNLKFDYENHSTDMSILAQEQFWFKSTQLNMIIAKKENTSILIDIIGAAGSTGILHINWWSEKGYTKRVKKVLKEYVDEFNLHLEES
jgi:hypothetical protein